MSVFTLEMSRVSTLCVCVCWIEAVTHGPEGASVELCVEVSLEDGLRRSLET